MKECDILGVKMYSDPSYMFSVGQDPRNPQDTPLITMDTKLEVPD